MAIFAIIHIAPRERDYSLLNQGEAEQNNTYQGTKRGIYVP